MAVHELRERLERVPRDGLPAVDREVPERFDEVALPRPGRPAHADDLCAVDPFEGPERLLGLRRDR